jgi:glycosyltransferase involved in cell wall biosynthesis
VRNCPRTSEISPPRAAVASGQLRVLYQGSIVPERLPLTLLEAVAHLPDAVRLCVIGYETRGHLGYGSQLLETARRLGIEHRVQLRAEIPHYQVLWESRQCDVGLALMPAISDDVNLRWMTGASNKPFEYLANGLAILVSDLADWRNMFVEPGYGLPCVAEDPASIAAALRWLLEHPAERRAMGERGRRRIATDWNYETEFAPVLDWMGRTVARTHIEPSRGIRIR